MSNATRRNTYRECPNGLVDALNEILHPRRVTDDLLFEFALAFRLYGDPTSLARRRAEISERNEQMRRLLTAAATLQHELHLMKARSRHGKGDLSANWEPLGPNLQIMIDRLTAWLKWFSGGAPRRGNPHYGQSAFRHQVLAALNTAGIPLSNPKGQAARVLARLLEELDRRYSKPKQERTDFSGTRWARWVHDALLQAALMTDFAQSELPIEEWQRTRAPIVTREFVAAQKATKLNSASKH